MTPVREIMHAKHEDSLQRALYRQRKLDETKNSRINAIDKNTMLSPRMIQSQAF
jgi:hypothetical protein